MSRSCGDPDPRRDYSKGPTKIISYCGYLWSYFVFGTEWRLAIEGMVERTNISVPNVTLELFMHLEIFSPFRDLS